MKVLFAAIVLASVAISRAQLTPEEAYARLQANTKPTTQPTAQEVQDLRQALAMLRAENAKLKKELAELRVKALPVKATTAPAAKGKPSPLPNLSPEDFVASLHQGMTLDDANKFILSCNPKNSPLTFRSTNQFTRDGAEHVSYLYTGTVQCGQNSYMVELRAENGVVTVARTTLKPH